MQAMKHKKPSVDRLKWEKKVRQSVAKKIFYNILYKYIKMYLLAIYFQKYILFRSHVLVGLTPKFLL